MRHPLFMALALLLALSVSAQTRNQAPAASPSLSCEQMVAAAQAGIDQRNQGASLSRVLAELDRPELRERLSAEDQALLRRAVQMSYTSEISIHELAETCNASRGVKPKR